MTKHLTEKVRKLRRARKTGEFVNSQRKEVERELEADQKSSQAVIQQVQEEYDLGWRYLRGKLQEALIRLKLYNNQKRDKDRVGDSLLYTNFQTIHAALYEDDLTVEFGGREEGDQDTAENLNGLAVFDYDVMGKAELDYELNWDALFNGWGLVYFNDFDFDSKTPIPVVWDPMTFIRDPHAISPNGNRLGQGAMRFGYREVSLTKNEMEDNGTYFNLGQLKRQSGIDVFGLVEEMRRRRDEAQGRENMDALSEKRTNQSYTILQGFTIIDGEKYWVELGNDRNLLIRMEPIEGGKWPLIKRNFSPISHDWDGVSIPDILEDKQRFRAVLLNVLGDAARADVYPMYLFNEKKIKKSIDKNFAFNKWIPVDGDIGDAAKPLQKANPSNLSQFILEFLDVSAQRALATPELRQGVPSEKSRTLGELELVSAGVDNRYSLVVKIFGWSERDFWKRWYEIYDRDFKSGIGKKVMRLMSTFGPTWRDITRDKIIVGHPLGPDIKIESRVVSEAKKIRNFKLTRQFVADNIQNQNFDALYAMRKLGRLVFPKDEVERMLPLTIDELEATEENERINNGEYVPVRIEQNHPVHFRMLTAAKEGLEKEAHAKAHRFMMMAKRMRPELFPMMPEETTVPMSKSDQESMPVGKAPEAVAPQQNAGIR